MLVSCDFSVRMVGHLIPQVPVDKAQVFDNNFESVMRKLGPHEAFIDISRCKNLTTLPFRCFSLCSSLLYLDISYTRLNDLKVIAENCYDLRGINISGLELMDRTYTRVASLASLEVLVMRKCNVLNVDWLENLPMLRSLDLGMNNVKTDPVWHVRNLTRLEELALDCSTFLAALYANVDVFDGLPALKLLNICETPLEPCTPQIVDKIGRLILVESAARRYLSFFHEMQCIRVSSGTAVTPTVHCAGGCCLPQWR
jgi:hypothetical protein